MKKIVFLLVALTFMSFNTVRADDDLAAKITLAKRYSAVVPVAEEIKRSVDEIVLQVPIDKRALFRSILDRSIKADRITTVSEMALAETFTKDELEALVTFYESDQGQAVRQKMPEYQQKIKPIVEQMIKDAVESYNAQTK